MYRACALGYSNNLTNYTTPKSNVFSSLDLDKRTNDFYSSFARDSVENDRIKLFKKQMNEVKKRNPKGFKQKSFKRRSIKNSPIFFNSTLKNIKNTALGDTNSYPKEKEKQPSQTVVSKLKTNPRKIKKHKHRNMMMNNFLNKSLEMTSEKQKNAATKIKGDKPVRLFSSKQPLKY